MAMTSNGKQVEINVTPLIDILLVLLIIFMVIEPTSVRGLEALVPKPSSSAHSESNDSPIVLQVSTDNDHGVIYKLDQTSLNASDLIPSLSRIFAARADKTMFIEGDAALNFAAVASVINSSHLAGADSIGIITTKP